MKLPSINPIWKHKPLSDVAAVILGQAPRGDSYNDTGIGLPLIAGAADLGARFPKPKKFTTAPNKVSKVGDIVLCVRATIGKTNRSDGVYCYGRGVAGIRALEVDTDFLDYWIQACEGYLVSKGRGATFKQISGSDVRDLPVPTPPISEQRRIVARIKECMDRIGEIEQLALSAELEWSALGQSLVEDALASVGGDETVLGEVAKIGSELVDPTLPQFFDLPHVGGANIESKTGRLLEIKTAREEKLKSSKFTFSADMVLYNKIRPYLVKVARPTFDGLCSADMYPLLPVSTLSRDFLYYQLTSLHFSDYAISGSNRAGMPKVNREHLFAYRFKLPSIEEQVSVSEKLDNAMGALDSARIVLREKANEVKAMRQSVLAMAFSGEM